jgi:hypothetical protein
LPFFQPVANSQRAVDLVLALPGKGRMRGDPVFADEADSDRNAVAKYWLAMGGADGWVLQLVERFPKAKVIMTDVRDLPIYRRNRNDAIPLIYP